MRYIALLAVMLLAGCGYFSKKGDDFSCPKTGFIEHARTAAITAPGTADIVAQADIQNFDGDCSIAKDKKSARLALNITFAARRGPAGLAQKDITLPYFIAVLSPEEEILNRQSFSTTVSFDNATGVGKQTEEHELNIPVPSPAEAYKYKVVMGFALTPEQLKHNKEH